jgi:hypothetical protein
MARGTARIASRALMITNGRISSPSVSPAERIVRPLAVLTGRRAEGQPAGDRPQKTHEDGQPQHTVDDRRHAGQVVDVGFDQPVELAAPLLYSSR